MVCIRVVFTMCKILQLNRCYNLISGLNTAPPNLHIVGLPWKLGLFICVPFQLPGEHKLPTTFWTPWIHRSRNPSRCVINVSWVGLLFRMLNYELVPGYFFESQTKSEELVTKITDVPRWSFTSAVYGFPNHCLFLSICARSDVHSTKKHNSNCLSFK